MNTKHTPGPWKLDENPCYNAVDIHDSEQEDRHIATAYWEPDADTGDETEEGMANAKLMAAAPEMLEALEEAKAAMIRFGRAGEAAFKKVVEAIEKARN